MSEKITLIQAHYTTGLKNGVLKLLKWQLKNTKYTFLFYAYPIINVTVSREWFYSKYQEKIYNEWYS